MPAYVDTGLNVVHVDDVAEGHALALERGRVGERYILGGEDLGMADLLALVARIAGRKPPRVKLPHAALVPVALASEGLARAFGIEPLVTRDILAMAKKKMFFSSAKARAELGYAPREDFMAGLAELAEWVAKQEAVDNVATARRELEARGLVA